MNSLPQSPWPSIFKVLLILGCTLTFCLVGLVAGLLAAKALVNTGEIQGDVVLILVLAPPAIGSLFGLAVGLISAWFVRWSPRPPATGPGPSKEAPPVQP